MNHKTTLRHLAKLGCITLFSLAIASCGGGGGGNNGSNGSTDILPPNTSITTAPSSLTNATNASFTFTSTESGSTFECSIDGVTYIACISPKSYTGLTAGNYSFSVQATDAAGNTDATPAQYNWTIDVTPPDTSISSGPGSLTNATNASFTFTSTESGSTFECSIDGVTYIACISPKSYTGLTAGNYSFSVQATDAAGNTDPTPAQYTWVIDLSMLGSVGKPFPIEITPSPVVSASAAFDGTNWLVGTYNINLNGVSGTYLSAWLLDTSGTIISSRIPISSNTTSNGFEDYELPHVAFDGTNYLLVWSDNSNKPNDNIYGQFINTSGAKVGAIFPISLAAGGQRLRAVVFDGTNYFVVWDDDSRAAQFDRYIYAQLVSTSGKLVGTDIKISTNKARFSSVAYNGTDYIVAWLDDNNHTDIIGRFVTTNGALGSEFTINANTVNSENGTSIACDTSSGNCLVAWLEEYDVPNKKWDMFHQMVSPTGSLIGPAPNLSTASGHKNIANVSYDGTHFLITWLDLTNDTNLNLVCEANESSCLDVYGRYIDSTGSPTGSAFAINTNPNNQLGFLAGYGGGKYLVLINEGFTVSTQGFVNDVYGQFVTP